MTKDDSRHKIIIDLVGEDRIDKLLPIKRTFGNIAFKILYDPHKDFNSSFLDISQEKFGFTASKDISEEYLFNKHEVDLKNCRDLYEREDKLLKLNRCIACYNMWVRIENEKTRELVVKEVPFDADGNVTTGDLNEVWATIDRETYDLMSHIPMWEVSVQFHMPTRRELKPREFLGLGIFDNEFLYRMRNEYMRAKNPEDAVNLFKGDEPNIDSFSSSLNVYLFEHIVKMRQVAVNHNDWNENNLFWYPNREFTHYFQKHGIDPDDEVYKFPQKLVDDVLGADVTVGNESKNEKTFFSWDFPNRYKDLFGIEEFHQKDGYSYKKLAEMVMEIYYEKPHFFQEVKRNAFREACHYWKLFGDKYPDNGQILSIQLEKSLHK